MNKLKIGWHCEMNNIGKIDITGKILEQNIDNHERLTIVCCLCGIKAEDYEWDNENDWGRYENLKRTTITLQEGKCYPDGGGDGTTIVIDICVECFKTKLIPWIEKQNGIIRKTEWNLY